MMTKSPTAFITGAANGIGAATARLLAAKGWRVFLTDLDDKGLEAIGSELGEPAETFVLDVREPAAWNAALDRAFELFGSIDVMISNAGKLNCGYVLDLEPEQILEHFEINVMGVVHGLRAAFPRLKVQGHGRIITMASLASFVPVKGQVTYCASKHAVRAVHYGFVQENEGKGVDFSIIHPGAVDTGMIQQMLGKPAGALAYAEPSVTPEQVASTVWVAISQGKDEMMIPSGNRLLRLVGVFPKLLYPAIRSAEKRGFKRMTKLQADQASHAEHADEV